MHPYKFNTVEKYTREYKMDVVFTTERSFPYAGGTDMVENIHAMKMFSVD
jgi:hypothetical protein